MTTTSHFLKLPAEIRLHIYEYLYVPIEGGHPVEASLPIWGSTPIWIHELELHRGYLYSACSTTKRAFLSILQVCKLLNEELLGLIFERMLFIIFMPNSKLPPIAPKLGRAKDFRFWPRVRRILLVADEDCCAIKHIIRDLGRGFRCFESTPRDTTAFVYMHDDLEHGMGRHRTKYRESIRKSLSSLSKRAELNFDIRLRHPFDARDDIRGLADATNGTTTLINVDYRHSGIPRAGNEEIEVSREKFQGERTPDVAVDADAAIKARVVCLMSSKARLQARRSMALERRRERILIEKRLYEGRLG